MTTSGTTSFFPGSGDLAGSAFARIGLKRAALTAEHLFDAQNEANFAQVEFANRQPNLWTVETTSVPLVQGTASYTLTADFIAVITAYVTTVSGTQSFDRVLGAISMSEYASYPSKTTQGPPTVYWYNAQVTPTITLFPVPDLDSTYTLNLLRLRQIQDATLAGGLNPDIPYRWLDAWVWALAKRLSLIYAPEKFQLMDGQAERAWTIAATQDIEHDVPLTVTPGLGSYYV